MARVRRPHVYEAVAWKSPAPGASDTRKVDLKGFAKLNSPAGPLCVANEYICSHLAARIGLPVPPGAVIRTDTGDLAWTTLSFTATPLPPIDPAIVAARVPALATEVVVFDILIANTDRHAGNLAFMSADRRLEVFDHSHALLGPGAAAGVAHYYAQANALAIGGHCLLPYIADPKHIGAAVDQIVADLTNPVIRRVVAEAAALKVGFAEAGPLADALILRRDNLRTLINRESHQFTGMPAGWSAL